MGPEREKMMGEGETMKTLLLKNRFQNNITILTNEFIDVHMAQANGEFVKVYLFLLRHIDNPAIELSIPLIADALNHTENDIIRAFRYWEKSNILSLILDEEKHIIGIEFDKTSENPMENVAKKITGQVTTAPKIKEPSPKAIPFDSYKAQKESEKAEQEIKTVLHIAEQYLGKTLTATEIDTIIYLFEVLEMDCDLIDYLIGSCVDNGNNNIQYIKKVAFSWSEKGIKTVKAAVAEALNYNKAYTTVLHTFGIRNRGPAASEIEYIKKWTLQYGLDLEIIVEACSRTIAKTSQPSFNYADSILTGWHKSNVGSMADISILDEQFRQNRDLKKKKETKARKSVKGADNYEKRDYDWEKMENQLLANK